MSYLHLNGSRLYYDTEGNGCPIVLVHDGLCHCEVWNGVWEILKKRFRVVRYDRRGYGKSDVPTEPYLEMEDLHRLIEHLKLEKVTLVGSSAGGGLCIHYALDYPENVSSLVLVGAVVTGFDYSEHFQKRGDEIMRPLLEEGNVQKCIEKWTDDPYLFGHHSKDSRVKFKALMTLNPQNLTHDCGFTYWPRNPALPRLREIKIPTLLITGEFDIPDVHAHAGAIQAGIKGTRRVVIEDSGHLMYLEKPDRFSGIITDFLENA